jgi:glutamine synthetase
VHAHAKALPALCAPSPVSALRPAPHHWSAGAVCLGERNRDTLLRIPPIVDLAATGAEAQMRLEFRGADAAANPHLALAAILQAGLQGIEAELPAPPILDRDPTTLSGAETEKFGVDGLPGSLRESLAALQADEAMTAWLPPLMREAYVSIKQAELAATADLPPEERCRRYADAY